MDQSFPRVNRILLGRDFERIMRTGRRVASRNLIVFVAEGPAGEPRIGLAVGRKVGPAAVRNRWKRLLREAFRRELKGRMSAVDVVIAVKAAPGAADRGKVRAQSGGRPRRDDAAPERRIAPPAGAVAAELADAVRRAGALVDVDR